MKPVRVVRGTMVPLDRADVDTDQIIPQRFLKRIERHGYGEFVFYNWAHHDDDSPIEDFITNRPERSHARILVAGRNFGCGSSREHAPWALQDWGFDAVIAPSTADIFRNNSANIGLLVVELPENDVRRLMEMAVDPAATITIDLERQTVVGEGLEATFDFDPSAKERLLGGLDWIGMTLTHEESIARHEMGRPAWLPVSTGSETS
ncbi:MAG TPA: 3-isopropylmalate dehydratase small subunit [Acidimicrobiia bacterium]|nr:3-isopropylmalate dehydratase small subunit [Acidimicrobiia bacterium]